MDVRIGRGDTANVVGDVERAREEFDLSATGLAPATGGGDLPARAVVLDRSRDASRRGGADPVYPGGRILGAEADDGEVLSLTLATGGGTRTVDRVRECRVVGRAGDPGDDGDADAGDHEGAGRDDADADDGDGTAAAPPAGDVPTVSCTLVDGTDWSLSGRPVAVEAEQLDRIGA